MITVTINNPSVAKTLLLSIMSFSSDAKFEIGKTSTRIPLKCDIPDKMRIEFKSNIITSSERVNVCIKELQRLYRAMDMVCGEVSSENPIEMVMSDKNDFLIYQHGAVKFKIGLVTDRALIGCVDTDEFKTFNDVYSFEVTMDRIKTMFKNSAIVRSSDARIFILNEHGNEVSAKLEDEESPSSGMLSLPMSGNLLGGEFVPLILKSDMFKCLVKFPGDRMIIHYTDKKAIIAESECKDGPFVTTTRVMFAPKKSRNTR